MSTFLIGIIIILVCFIVYRIYKIVHKSLRKYNKRQKCKQSHQKRLENRLNMRHNGNVKPIIDLSIPDLIPIRPKKPLSKNVHKKVVELSKKYDDMTNNTIQAHSDLLTAVDTVNTSIQQLNDIQHEVNSTVGVSNTQLSQLNEAETNVLTATAASQTAQALLDTNIHIQTETANALNTLSEVAEEQDVDTVIEEIIEEVDDVVEDANAQQEEVVEEIEEFFSRKR